MWSVENNTNLSEIKKVDAIFFSVRLSQISSDFVLVHQIERHMLSLISVQNLR